MSQRLKYAQVLAIKELAAAGCPVKELAEAFHVSRKAIGDIKAGRTHANVRPSEAKLPIDWSKR